MDIGEPEVSSLVFEGELLVVDSQQVQDGCMEIMNMDGVGGNVVTERIGLTVAGPSSDSSSSKSSSSSSGR